MTESEINVANFFDFIGHKLTRVVESPDKTPDLFIKTSKQEIFLEVKEVVENQDEKEINKKFEENQLVVIGDENLSGERFRDHIRNANRKYKAACLNNEASLTVIQDIRSFANSSCCPQEEIKQAMFGNNVTWINFEKREIVADMFQENKTITEKKNTSTSAVSLLIKDFTTGDMNLHIFHNPFAKTPLISPIFKANSVYEYEIPDTRNYCNFILKTKD